MPLKTTKKTKSEYRREELMKEAAEKNQKDVEAFMADYKQIVAKHGIDFEYYLRATERGIFAASRLIRVDVNTTPKQEDAEEQD